jgi:hypothetical protein
VVISEVAPWGSSDPTYAADWWELTNNSGATIDLTGWKIDDESSAFGSAVALNGVSTLAPGQSAIFVEGDATKAAAFTTFWFGSSVPPGFQIGFFTVAPRRAQRQRHDAVNVFNASGNHLTGVKFGAATTASRSTTRPASAASRMPLCALDPERRRRQQRLRRP